MHALSLPRFMLLSCCAVRHALSFMISYALDVRHAFSLTTNSVRVLADRSMTPVFLSPSASPPLPPSPPPPRCTIPGNYHRWAPSIRIRSEQLKVVLLLSCLPRLGRGVWDQLSWGTSLMCLPESVGSERQIRVGNGTRVSTRFHSCGFVFSTASGFPFFGVGLFC